jgi:hypothetical protein
MVTKPRRVRQSLRRRGFAIAKPRIGLNREISWDWLRGDLAPAAQKLKSNFELQVRIS